MAEQTTQTGFLEVQGAPLYYEVTGQGHPLLLLHAGVADSRMWAEQVPVFAQHYQTICYDLRGFGRSSLPAGRFAGYEDPALLLRSLGAEKTHVVGISWGGKIALDFTLAHPEMVSALVLVAPSVGGHQPSARVLRFGEEEEALLEQGDLAAATELNLRMWVDGPQRTPEQIDPAVRQRVYEMLYHDLTVPMPEGAEEQSLEPPARRRLAEIRVPTLVMVGDYDLPEKQELAALLAERIPGAQQVVIPGVAHMVNMEKPAEFNQAVLAFLGRL
jgi:3-oxoadipate enol-lactonase